MFKNYFVAMLLFLYCFKSTAQQAFKPLLTEKDYAQWSTLHPIGASSDGGWICYSSVYVNGKDSLYLYNSRTERTYRYGGARSGIFGAAQWFAFKRGDSLFVLDLKRQGWDTILRVQQFFFTRDGGQLLTIQQGAGGVQGLQVWNNALRRVDSLTGVEAFKLNPDRSALLFVARTGRKRTLSVMDLSSLRKDTLLSEDDIRFENLSWHTDGSSLGFFSGPDTPGAALSVYVYRHKDRLLRSLQSELPRFQEKRMRIDKEFRHGIRFTSAGFVLFGIIQVDTSAAAGPDAVQVWDASDTETYQTQALSANYGVNAVAVWDPASGTCRILTTSSATEIELGGDGQYALISGQADRVSAHKRYEHLDYQLVSLATGEEHTILTEHYAEEGRLYCSPLSRHLVYYRKQQWWLFDPQRDSHTSLTKGVAAIWDMNNDTNARVADSPFGIAGWTRDGKGVLLYDQFDLWYFSLDLRESFRLTRGREQQMAFRISRKEWERFPVGNMDGKGSAIFDLKKEQFLFEARGETDHQSGYFIWQGSRGLKKIVYSPAEITEGLRVGSLGLMYLLQRFDKSPALYLHRDADAPARLVATSNPQQSLYAWGHSELVYYADRRGHTLKAALFYPANFQAGKTYPMITHIYEKRSRYLHVYENPTVHDSEGFSITHLTQQGYFVLLPDIAYEIGNTGIAATDCVVAAVRAVLNKGIVDSTCLGLIGHSFGGYETGFILTQTNLFAAAVSGAGIYDIAGNYFDIDPWGYPEMWRYEDFQFRMGRSFYEDKDGYFRNSPIIHADKIETPLLTWSGEDDPTVPVSQSKILYTALHRLRKPHTMLIYPGETHALAKPVNQQDLTHRIQDWFDRYLKK